MGCGSSKAVTVHPYDNNNPDTNKVSPSSTHSTIAVSQQSSNTVTSLSSKTTTSSQLVSPDRTLTRTALTDNDGGGGVFNRTDTRTHNLSTPSPTTDATNIIHPKSNDTYDKTVTVDTHPQIIVNNQVKINVSSSSPSPPGSSLSSSTSHIPPHTTSNSTVHEGDSTSNIPPLSSSTDLPILSSSLINVSSNNPSVSSVSEPGVSTTFTPTSLHKDTSSPPSDRSSLSITPNVSTSHPTITYPTTTSSTDTLNNTVTSISTTTVHTSSSSAATQTTTSVPSSSSSPPFVPPLLLSQDQRQSSDTTARKSATGFIGRFIESTRRASITMLGLGSSSRHLTSTHSSSSPSGSTRGGLLSSPSDSQQENHSKSTRSPPNVSPQSSLSKLFGLGKSTTSLSPSNSTNNHQSTSTTTTASTPLGIPPPHPKKEGSESKRSFLGMLTGNTSANSTPSGRTTNLMTLTKPRSIYQPKIFTPQNASSSTSASSLSSSVTHSQTAMRTDSSTEFMRNPSQYNPSGNSDYYRSFSQSPGGLGGSNNSNNNSQVIEVNKEIKVKDEAGNKRVNHFLMMEVIGRGAYGKVRKCLDEETGTIRAVKIIRKSLLKRKRVGRFGNAFESVQREMAIWKKLEHPYVLKLFEIVDDESSDKLYMVGEYIDGGPIMPDEQVCEAIPIDDARRYMAMLTDGLAYLHFQRVVHRDIKPGNLLIDRTDKILRISDFGVSQVYEEEDDNIRSTAGTAPFLAPEMLTGGHFSGRVADIWAVGITLYMFIYGTTPFLADTVPAIYENIRHKTVEWPDRTARGKPLDMRMIEPAKDLVMRLLDRNPDTRISIEEIRMHPFVRAANIPIVPLPMEPIEVTELEIMNAISNVVKLRAVIKASLVAKRSLARVRTKLKLNAALAFADGLEHRRKGGKDEDDDEQDVQTIEHVDMLDNEGNVIASPKKGMMQSPKLQSTNANNNTHNNDGHNNLNTSTSSTVIMKHLVADQVIKEEDGNEPDESTTTKVIPSPTHRSIVSTTGTNHIEGKDTTNGKVESSTSVASSAFPVPLDKSDTFKLKAVASFTGLEPTHIEAHHALDGDDNNHKDTNSTPTVSRPVSAISNVCNADNQSRDDGKDSRSEVSDTESYARTEDSRTSKENSTPVSLDQSSHALTGVSNNNDTSSSPVLQLGPGVPRYRLYVTSGDSRSSP